MLRQAVILAGGMGTRLGALTANTPKPLLKVGGQPFVEYLLKHLTRHGVSRRTARKTLSPTLPHEL